MSHASNTPRRSVPRPSCAAGSNRLLANGQDVAAPQVGVETLESRLLLSALRMISGKIYFDADSDGRKDHKEKFIRDIPVFVDLNANGALDAGEPVTATNKMGQFVFRKLPRALYRLIAEPPAGQAVAIPAGGVLVVNALKHGVSGLRVALGPAPISKEGKSGTGLIFCDPPNSPTIVSRQASSPKGRLLVTESRNASSSRCVRFAA